MPASEVGPVAIVGGGSIGVAWAVVFARAGRAVRIHDVDEARRLAIPAEAAAALGQLARHGLLDEPVGDVAARIAVCPVIDDAVDGALHVQEAGPERVDLKRELLARIDALAPAGATIASSSSAIPISQVAAELPGRARILVAHPANPPYLLPIVELVGGPATAPWAIAAVSRLLEASGMAPVTLGRELEGFALNRLQGALLREAYCLVRDGVLAPDDVDRLVRDGLGRRWALMGPFETADLNTRGGIERHAQVMGPAYARMGAERGQDDPWTPDLVQRVTAARRARLPLARWSARAAWRDRALMRLEAARQAIDRFGPAEDGPSAVLVLRAAPLAEDTAVLALAERWGVAGTPTRLPSERDDVFRIDAAGVAYILEVAHPDEPAEVGDLVTSAMLHLEAVAPELPVERLVPALDGARQVRLATPDGERSARLSTLLPGQVVRGVAVSPALRREIGRTLARLHLALDGFTHPAAGRELLWDVQRAHLLRPLLAELATGRDDGFLWRWLDRFEAHVRPALAGLREVVAHNDLGSDNLLVGPGGDEIVGVIDFGGMTRTASANDVAVAAAYQLDDGPDPLPGALDVIAGYHAVRPLLEAELDLLGELVLTRMAICIIVPEWRAARFPENRDYILRDTARSWAQAARLAELERDEIRTRIRAACGLEESTR